MLIGYGRVSTRRQETHLQMDAFKRAGVIKIFQEKADSTGERPQLRVAMASMKPGDVLVVWKIDRIARSLLDLLQLMQELKDAGMAFRSMTEPIDTSTPIGIFLVQILGAVAQLEKSMIRERTIAGQVAAIMRGAKIGRPRKLTEEQDLEVFTRWKAGETKASLSRLYDASDTTIDLALARFGVPTRKMKTLKPVLGPLLHAARNPGK